jgi:phytoene dehydrogenase-like protein
LSQSNEVGGNIQTQGRHEKLSQLPRTQVIVFDTTPRQFYSHCWRKLPVRYRRTLARFRYGPGIFKIDYAPEPIPWINEVRLRAGTIHIGGTFDEIAEAESEVAKGVCPGATVPVAFA